MVNMERRGIMNLSTYFDPEAATSSAFQLTSATVITKEFNPGGSKYDHQ